MVVVVVEIVAGGGDVDVGGDVVTLTVDDGSGSPGLSDGALSPPAHADRAIAATAAARNRIFIAYLGSMSPNRATTRQRGQETNDSYARWPDAPRRGKQGMIGDGSI
jgi:hypothetical protein